MLSIFQSLADEKIKGTYLGEIEDKYKNTYPVTTNLEITDEGVIKGQYEYKYGGKNWNGIFYDGKLLIVARKLCRFIFEFCSSKYVQGPHA